MKEGERMGAEKTEKIDKSTWGPGPWQDEPDRIEWRSEHGFPCLMVRQANHGAWCGYVAVPPGHDWHGRDMADLDEDEDGNQYGDGLDVHGGVTYSDKCAGDICHVPQPGEPDDVWWIGFDCVHSGDLTPATPKGFAAPTIRYPWQRIGGGREYRDAEYVRAQCERLAEQAKAAS